jgi:hypothetical protein
LPAGQVYQTSQAEAEGVGGYLQPEPKERAVLAKIAALRAAGLSLRAIAPALAVRGMLARNGRAFASMTLARLVPNRVMADQSQIDL